MNAVEKRDFIHSKLHLVDESVLNEMFDKVNKYLSLQEPVLSDEIKFALDEGLSSLEAGKCSTHEDVMRRMRAKFPNVVK